MMCRNFRIKVQLRLLLGLIMAVLMAGPVFAANPLIIDSYDRQSNLLGGKRSSYEREPSHATGESSSSQFYGEKGKSLAIQFDKKGTGGPYGKGGWCGYYTELKNESTFFDASQYKAISFYVKGAKGGENFMVGVSDEHWYELGDTVKSAEIGSYVPAGKITTQWQKATIPLHEFAADRSRLASIAFCFETVCFPDGAGRGALYIDELTLE
jgi:hypothetical protein